MQPLTTSVALLCATFVLTVLALLFRDLGVDWELLTVRPLITGATAGLALAAAAHFRGPEVLLMVTGSAFTIAALYFARNSMTGEPVDSIGTGTMIAIGSAIPLMAAAALTLDTAAAVVLAAPVALVLVARSYRHAQPVRAGLQFTALAASSAAAFVPRSVEQLGVRDLHVAIAIGLIAPVTIAATVLQRWPMLINELMDEARLGLFPAEDIARVSHPLRRFSRGGWAEKNAARHFVRISTKLAARKHQQRSMSPDTARLYQLEILKLRMELKNILNVERSYAAHAAGEGAQNRDDALTASDTMRSKGLEG